MSVVTTVPWSEPALANLGTVARQLLVKSQCPILTVSPDSMQKTHHGLVIKRGVS